MKKPAKKTPTKKPAVKKPAVKKTPATTKPAVAVKDPWNAFYAEAKKLKLGQRVKPVKIQRKVTIPATAVTDIVMGYLSDKYLIYTTFGDYGSVLKKAFKADLKRVDAQFRGAMKELKALAKKHKVKLADISWGRLGVGR
ncbi:MAG: hypothetical protein WC565_05265 [Parcubacteria group bacterium]|jgi:hypothetical protein